MSSLSVLEDFGTVYSKTGSAITTAYVASTAAPIGHYRDAAWFIDIVLDGASTITSVTVKIGVPYTGASTTARDVVSARGDDGSTAVEHTFSGLSGGNTYRRILHTTAQRGSPVGAYVFVKANNGGAVGDTITVAVGALS